MVFPLWFSLIGDQVNAGSRQLCCQALNQSGHYCIFAAPVCDVALIRPDLLLSAVAVLFGITAPCSDPHLHSVNISSVYSGFYMNESSGHLGKLSRFIRTHYRRKHS